MTKICCVKTCLASCLQSHTMLVAFLHDAFSLLFHSFWFQVCMLSLLLPVSFHSRNNHGRVRTSVYACCQHYLHEDILFSFSYVFFFFLLCFSRLSWCCVLCFLQLFSFQTLNLVFDQRNSQQAVIALQIDTSSWRFISPFLLFSKILCQGLFCRFRRRMCTTTTSLSVPFLPFTSKTCEAR